MRMKQLYPTFISRFAMTSSKALGIGWRCALLGTLFSQVSYACGPIFTPVNSEIVNHFNNVTIYPYSALTSSYSESKASKNTMLTLPPVLSNVTATVHDRKEVHLQWESAPEQTISYFEIQHSVNGRIYSSIGIIKAKDTHQFVHHNPVKGRNFYRIKVVFTNKTFENSPIVPVVVEQKEGEEKEASVYPNPVENGTLFFSTRAELSSSQISSYQLFVFDLEGHLVKQKMIISNQTTLISDLKKGTYIFEIFKNDDRIDQGQLIVR